MLISTHNIPHAESLEEETVLAALSLNIVRFTTWPTQTQTLMGNSINFCLVGDNVAQQSFASIDNKPIGNRFLHIVNLTRLRNLEQCHILFISELKHNILLQLLEEIKNRPLLTIGKGEEFTLTGGMIGLDNVDGKIRLHINLTTVRESNLNISARLLKLAKVSGN